MQEFRFQADFTFQAKNIDDALTKLSKHFKNIRDSKDSQLILLGEVRVEPIKKEDNDSS